MMRRIKLVGSWCAGIALGSFGLGCADLEPLPEPLPGPEEWNREVVAPSDAAAEAGRSSCAFGKGALAAETQGASRPNGAEIPVDHVLVLMLENRSFDHYFQKLPEYGQPDVEVAPAEFSNPDPEGKPVQIFHQDDYCFVDTNHGWAGTHQELNNGKMDGFVKANDGHHEAPANGTLDMVRGRRAMGYYDETDLPFYYALASEYAIADHYHCSVLGPTFPNRMFLYAASSFGNTFNTIVDGHDTLVDLLEKREVPWKIYATGTPGMGLFVSTFLAYKNEHLYKIDDFYADAAAGTLPAFAFLDPDLGQGGPDNDDEHPPSVMQLGQATAAKIVDALAKSPAWSRTVLFITYDEHGGLYDHVPPPKACPPDDEPLRLDDGDDTVAGFDQLGIRVPMMVVSPYAKKHFVSHHTYDHTSIVRFVEARFVLPALSGRDANAEAPWEMFDFENPPHKEPPTFPAPAVDQARVEACKTLYGK